MSGVDTMGLSEGSLGAVKKIGFPFSLAASAPFC